MPVPVVTGGAGETPPSVVHVAGFVHVQSMTFCPQPFGKSRPHLPAYVVLHAKPAQHVWVVLSHGPFGHVPHVSVPPHESSNVPHWNAAKSAHVFGVQGGPQTPLALQTWPVAQSPQLIVAPVHALLIVPQFLPCALHSSGVDFGSQRLAMPCTPQLSPFLQPKPGTVSQFTVPPQPFEMTPHSTPFVEALAASQSSLAVFTAVHDGVPTVGSQVWNTLLHVLPVPQPPQSV